ncbi:2Fe-2S iron-sulfur cluster-binding protein [Paenibacillus sp. GCM10023252]|uniref:2Fe-2S iron-sulfur cluster-binding protein n=1 Tax=Paenibacillus sp. GCM10023252 TaxID=3252649 RepID=UPI00361094DB
MIELTGRTIQAAVPSESGLSLLDHALKHKVDWAFSCSRGTCARCRCLVTQGAEALGEITDEEWDRMEPEEFDAGYRLGCQAIVKHTDITITAKNAPYF